VPRWVRILRFLAPPVGAAYGITIAFTTSNRTAPLWMTWAVLAIAATTAAGLVFSYGLGRWQDLSKLCTIPAAFPVIWPVMALALVSLALMNAPVLLPPAHVTVSGGKGSGLGSGLVGMFAIVAAVPVATVMIGMWRAVSGPAPLGPKDAPLIMKGDQLNALLELRRLLQRLLAAVGSVVALVAFSYSTWWLLERSLHTQFGSRPPQFVLIFGAFGSTLVGLVYGPAWTALQRRGRLLRDTMFSLRKVDEVTKIVSLAADRQTLDQMLGLDRGFLADLQSGLVILAPLLAGAVAAFLPH
jgi:hypothetical protein